MYVDVIVGLVFSDCYLLAKLSAAASKKLGLYNTSCEGLKTYCACFPLTVEKTVSQAEKACRQTGDPQIKTTEHPSLHHDQCSVHAP